MISLLFKFILETDFFVFFLKPVEFLDGHDGPIMSFFVEKECVYTGGWDRKIISWNIEV